MVFQEKLTWVNLVVVLVVPGAYVAYVLDRANGASVADFAYQRSMLIAIGISIIATILGTIAMSIVTAAAAEITGKGSVDDIDRKDERDVQISRRGDLIGYYVASGGAVGVMALTMLEYDYFWIANALYLSFVVASVVADSVKIAAYRRGF